jgi:hypothetical protein
VSQSVETERYEKLNCDHDQPIAFLVDGAKRGFIVAVMTLENRWAIMAISTLAPESL